MTVAWPSDDFDAVQSGWRYFALGREWVSESTQFPAAAASSSRIRSVLRGPLRASGSHSVRVQTWDEDEPAWWYAAGVPKVAATGSPAPLAIPVAALDGRAGRARLVLVTADGDRVVWWGRDTAFDYR